MMRNVGLAAKVLSKRVLTSLQHLTFEILCSVDSGAALHHRSPASAMEPAGQDLWAVPQSNTFSKVEVIAGVARRRRFSDGAEGGDRR
jgi:hypothetical protein